jgi:hypothetical protein
MITTSNSASASHSSNAPVIGHWRSEKYPKELLDQQAGQAWISDAIVPGGESMPVIVEDRSSQMRMHDGGLLSNAPQKTSGMTLYW